MTHIHEKQLYAMKNDDAMGIKMKNDYPFRRPVGIKQLWTRGFGECESGAVAVGASFPQRVSESSWKDLRSARLLLKAGSMPVSNTQ
jgi:hypothetical protein